MARNRMIKPEFFSDEKTGNLLSHGARLVYIGLWVFADDNGVLLNSPRKLYGDIFPIDESVSFDQFNSWVTELISLERLIPFEYKSQKYLRIRTWDEHQQISHPSKRAVPKDELNNILQQVSGVSPECLQQVAELNKKEKEKEKEKEKALRAPRTGEPVTLDDIKHSAPEKHITFTFEEFQENLLPLYPVNRRGRAVEAYAELTACLPMPTLSQVIAAFKAYQESDDFRDGKIQRIDNWLAGRPWNGQKQKQYAKQKSSDDIRAERMAALAPRYRAERLGPEEEPEAFCRRVGIDLKEAGLC